MKNSKSLWLLGSIFSVMIFAGCNTAANQPASQSSTQTQAVTQAALPVQHSETDTAAYQGALTLKDASYCDKISDQQYKQQCQTELSDNAAMAAALSKSDQSECAKLSTKDKQDACKIQVEVALKGQQQSQETQAKLDSIVANLNTIVASGDYTKCKTLDSATFQDNCEYNILVNKALEAKDPTICDKIANKNSIVACKDAVNAVAKTK